MKIEAGKFYKTRYGMKVRVYATDGAHTFPIHGAVYLKYEDKWESHIWKESGAFDGETPNDYDIVSEWDDDHPAENWPVDAKIFVREDKDENWKPRHFAKYENGHVFAWIEGKTSFTTNKFDAWSEAKLAEEN